MVDIIQISRHHATNVTFEKVGSNPAAFLKDRCNLKLPLETNKFDKGFQECWMRVSMFNFASSITMRNFEVFPLYRPKLKECNKGESTMQ